MGLLFETLAGPFCLGVGFLDLWGFRLLEGGVDSIDFPSQSSLAASGWRLRPRYAAVD
jgi:hypothetical protein